MSPINRLAGLITLLSLSLTSASAQNDSTPTAAPTFPLAPTAFNVGQACQTNLTREWLPTSNGAYCADGTQPLIYYDAPLEPSDQYLIVFGEGELCGTQETCAEICDRTADDEDLCATTTAEVKDGFDSGDQETALDKARCLFRRLQCSSSFYGDYDELRAETLMCRTDDHFGSYHRIYLPLCSMDWHIGNGDDDPNAPPTYLWRGRAIVDEMMLALERNGRSIHSASRVVLAGTGGGGVGMLNSFKRLRYGPLEGVPNVVALADSAFLISTDRFANLSRVFMGDGARRDRVDGDLRANVAGWIGRAALDLDCRAFWLAGEDSRCLYVNEVLRRGLRDEPVMILQSQYDLAMLAQLDLLNTSLTVQFLDNTSYAQGAVNYLEGFGANVRRIVESAAYMHGPADNHYFYTTACGMTGYLVPTELHIVEPRKADMGRAGKLEYRRDYAVWRQVRVASLSVRDAIVSYVSGNGLVRPVSSDPAEEARISQRNNVRSDRCQSFLCNPTCTEAVFSFELENLWGPCNRRLVFAYVYIMVAAWWFLFFLACIAVFLFRRKTAAYWHHKKAEEKASKAASSNPAEVEAMFRKDAEEQVVRDAFASNRKVHLMLREVSYWASPRSVSILSNEKPQAYQILRSVSATFGPGQVHALMGPSGSGKSTLLDLVALTRDAGFMVGTHYVNGLESHSSLATFLREWLRHNVSYVRQSDLLFPLLTVREHLTHAAWLMLPEFMDADQKLDRVNQVIKLMELEKAADTICGDGGVEVEGGISGGQRRRVSVATQLLRLPAALILDEPTSGLDSTNALLLVKTLHTLAHRGQTNVIMTIHQPRREIYRYLDTLKILVGGRIVFAGAPKEAFDHFDVSRKLNIGDEILDQLAKSKPEHILAYQRKYLDGPLGARVESEMAQEVSLDFNYQTAMELQGTLITFALAEGRWSWTESSSAPTLMYVLLSRTMRRGGFDVLKTVTISFMGGVLVGIVFVGSTSDSYTRRTALAYLCVAASTFLQGTFIGDRYWAEKFMYDFESDAGTARPWVSFLASMFTRIVVSSTLEGLAFAVPLFFISGMNNDGDRFATFIVLMVMVAITTSTQYLMVEIYFMRPDDKRTGALVNIALLSLSALFNGFIIQLKDLPIYLKWIPTVMLSYWGFVGILMNELKGFALPCDASSLECAARSGDSVIKGLRYDNRDIYVCVLALLLMTGIALLLGGCCFYWKWVHKYGNGLTRKSSKALRDRDKQWNAHARGIQRQTDAGGSTMDGVLAAGKLTRQGSADKLTRQGSVTSESSGTHDSSFKVLRPPPALARAPSEIDLETLESGPGAPPGFEDTDAGGDQTTVAADSEEADGEEGERGGCCGCACIRRWASPDHVFLRSVLSRLILIGYFVADFLASSVVCNGQASDAEELARANAEALNPGVNASSIIDGLTKDFSLSSIGTTQNPVFVAITGIFLCGYIFQYVVQFIILIPRDIDGRLRLCNRVALLDLVGFIAMGIDVILLFVLIGAGRGAYTQIYIMVGVRAVRLIRVLSYWFKIQAFHRLRAIAFLVIKEQNMMDYDPTANVEYEPHGLDDADNKPSVPSKASKPAIPAHLVALMHPQQEAVATGGRSLLKSMRLATGWAGGAKTEAVAPAETDGTKRLSKRPSQTQDQPLMAAGRPSVLAGRRISISAAGGPPPVVPRIPAAMLNLGGMGAPLPGPSGNRRMSVAASASSAHRRSVAGPPPFGFAGASQQAGGQQPQMYRPNPAAPPIAPRQMQSLAAFGLGGGGQRLVNQRGQYVPRAGEPSPDEV